MGPNALWPMLYKQNFGLAMAHPAHAAAPPCHRGPSNIRSHAEVEKVGSSVTECDKEEGESVSYVTLTKLYFLIYTQFFYHVE